jgi:hypothetical protein
MKHLLLSTFIFLFTVPCFSQFIEEFENTTGITGPLPATWTLGSGDWKVFERNSNPSTGTSQSWGINPFAAGFANGGVNCASIDREEIGIGNTSHDYLATPVYYIPAVGSALLSFSSRTFTSGNQGTIFRISVASANDPSNQTNPDAFITLQQWTENDLTENDYQTIIVQIPSFIAGQDVFFLFEREHTQTTAAIGGDRWMIDDINTLTTNSNCPPPSAPAVTAITNTSALLNWTTSITSPPSEVVILPFGSPIPTGSGIPVFSPSFVATDLSPDLCYTAYVRSVCNPNSISEWSSVDFCLIDCQNSGQCPEKLMLIAFLDANTNGIKDTDETIFNYGNFAYQINSGSTIYGNNNNGAFSIFESNPANNYNLSFHLNSNLNSYYNSSTTYSNINVPVGSGSNVYYFPITQLQTYNDLEIQIILTSAPRAGFSHTNIIIYKNKGTDIVTSGTITFTKDNNVSISSLSQSGTTPTANGFTYNFTNLAPFESRFITVGLLVPTIPTVALGDLINTSASIQINNDIDISNNASQLTQTIVGSYDPNDKTESHGGKIIFEDFTSNDYLYYTIQFENTGTASAEFIRIEDVLDVQLDETTFEMINASHNVNTRRNGNQLTWHFYHIDLPPTVTNPAESHGYVYFKIKPKSGYAIGDIIPNFASIYFDYNPPIITESFNTEFVQALGTPTFNSTTISLYPNPTNSKINITNNGIGKISKVAIYEISGKRIYTMNENTLDTIAIDVSHFAKGIYLVELTSDTNSTIIKKLILK